MANFNKKARKTAVVKHKKQEVRPPRLAGGQGAVAALEPPELQMRRVILANLLGEDLAYQTGKEVAKQIRDLVPQLPPEMLSGLAVEARRLQRLRHVSLYLTREMFRIPEYRQQAGKALAAIIDRADDMTDFLAMYWEDGEAPLANQVKKALRKNFEKLDAYQIRKHHQSGMKHKLREVAIMTHPKPRDKRQSQLWKDLLENKAKNAKTWEVKVTEKGADKRANWEELIKGRKLGAQAFLRNLEQMTKAGVPFDIIHQGFNSVNTRWISPLDYFKAFDHAPQFRSNIEDLMFRSLAKAPRLPGHTVLVVDVSGSMFTTVSTKSQYNRIDVAAALAVIAQEMGEQVDIWITAGRGGHATEKIPGNLRGFALSDAIRAGYPRLGGGGIYTTQAINFVHEKMGEVKPDRLIIFSDSQDCDYNSPIPKPFGTWNYIVDVSAHTHGVNYAGVWNGGEISGWSEYFLAYIMLMEKPLALSGAESALLDESEMLLSIDSPKDNTLDGEFVEVL